jgi:hypothetical protein
LHEVGVQLGPVLGDADLGVVQVVAVGAADEVVHLVPGAVLLVEARRRRRRLGEEVEIELLPPSSSGTRWSIS